jgi:hypothetical protein
MQTAKNSPVISGLFFLFKRNVLIHDGGGHAQPGRFKQVLCFRVGRKVERTWWVPGGNVP